MTAECAPIINLVGNTLSFYCPACKTTHAVKIAANGWVWNEDHEHPTIMPSLLSVNGDRRCHLFVSNGQLQYLTDSNHKLTSQTVPIPLWPY